MSNQSIVEKVRTFIENIMMASERKVIGVDIGTSFVKICELSMTRGNKIRLEKFSAVPLPESAIIEDEIHNKEDIVEALSRALKSSGIKNKTVCLGVSGPNTIAKRFPVAVDNPSEIEDQVVWESEQYIPFDVDESTIAFHIIGKNPGGGTDVMMAAAKNDHIETYRGLLHDAGLKVKIIDLSVFALNNIFEYVVRNTAEFSSKRLFLIIDFGAQITTLFVYKENAIIFSREINIGGEIITEEIQRMMGVNYLEAENLKTIGDEQGNLPEEIMNIIDLHIDKFFEEIKKTINFFMTANSEDRVEHCFITGGSSLLPGLQEGLEGSLEVPVDYLNPFNVIEFSKKAFNEDTLSYITMTGLTSMGLAMRSFD